MEFQKKLAVILVTICTILSLSACHKDEKAYRENIILSKQECIDEAKAYLEVSDIYFFDCDFSNLKNFKITDTAYNISVSGKKIYNKTKQRYILDLSESASIQIVSNYRIENYNDCFGFSIISEIMIPKWRNSERNILFSENMFSKFVDLYNQGDTQNLNASSLDYTEIETTEDFYPIELKKCKGLYSTYYKTKGIPLSENFDIICSVLELKSYFYSQVDRDTQKEIKDHLINFATYKKF